MPNDLDPLFQSAADQYGLPVGFLKAIAQQETGTNPNSRDSYQGAQGLMQMLPQTAAAMGAQDPRDPAQAIPAAARYLREGLDATGSLSGAAAYYHGGPDRKQWGPKTSNYVQSVGSIFNRMPQERGAEPRTVSIEEALGDTGKAPPAMASDDFDKRWGIGAAASSAPEVNSGDDFDKRWGIKSDSKAAAASPSTGDLQSTALGAGLVNGIPIAGPYILSGLEKAGAAANAVLNNSRYSDELATIQKRVDDANAQHGTASNVGNIGGAVAGYVAGGIPAAGAKVLGYTGAMVPRMLWGAGSNALIGGTDAAVRGHDPLVGGAIGMVGGATAPIIGGIAGGGINKLTDLRDKFMPTGIEGVSRPAADLVNRAIANEGSGAVQNSLIQNGEHGMLADAGPSLTGLTRALRDEVGPSQGIVENALVNRTKGAGDRVSSQLDESLGPAYDPNMVARDIEQTRNTVARPLYERAHNNAPSVQAQSVIDEIDSHLKSAEGNQKKALQNVRDMLTEQVEKPVLNPDGSQAMGPGPSVRNAPRVNDPTKGPAPISLHDFVRNWGGINDEHGELQTLGLGKLANPKGMSLDDMRRNAAEQGYLGANIDDAMANTYATDLLDALEKGKKVFSANDQDRLGLQKMQGRDPSNGWSTGPMVPQVETQTVPKSGSRNLHNIRQELDNVIEHDAPGLGVPASAVSRSQDSLKAVRAKLDEVLKGQVPGMSEADSKFAALAERQNALERGYTKVLRADGPHPDTFAADRAAQAPGVNIAENMGIRGRIDRMFGAGTQRDPAILNKLLAGGDEDKYAVQNLQTAFGTEPVNKLVNTLKQERTFADTHQEVLRGSATSRSKAAGEWLKEATPGTLNLTSASLPGMVAQGIKSLIADPAISMILRSSPDSMRAEMAHILTAGAQPNRALGGLTRDEVVAKLLALQARQGRNSALGAAASNAVNVGANRLTMGVSGTQHP